MNSFLRDANTLLIIGGKANFTFYTTVYKIVDLEKKPLV